MSHSSSSSSSPSSSYSEALFLGALLYDCVSEAPPSEAGCSLVQPEAPPSEAGCSLVQPEAPPSEAGCSLVQPAAAPAQAPAVPATKTNKRPYTSVGVQDFATSRPFNSEERKIIDRLVDPDRIFDAKRKFDPKLPGGPGPVNMVNVKKDPSRFRRLTKCATLAIEDYNSQTHSNYRFVNIEMSTRQLVHGILYHITFKARNARNAKKKLKTFQATVIFNYNCIKVKNIRIKGSSAWYHGVLSELI